MIASAGGIDLTKKSTKTDESNNCKHWFGLCLLSKDPCRDCVAYTPKAIKEGDNDEPFPLMFKEIPILRENILKHQNGICTICGNPPTRPVLDHSHKKRIGGSSLCRGVLCANCNSYLGVIENRAQRYGFQQDKLVSILMKIAGYLSQDHYQYIHPTERPKSPKLRKDSYNKLLKLIKKSKVNTKVPTYTGNCTKPLMELFKKYKIVPEFYK